MRKLFLLLVGVSFLTGLASCESKMDQRKHKNDQNMMMNKDQMKQQNPNQTQKQKKW